MNKFLFLTRLVKQLCVHLLRHHPSEFFPCLEKMINTEISYISSFLSSTEFWQELFLWTRVTISRDHQHLKESPTRSVSAPVMEESLYRCLNRTSLPSRIGVTHVEWQPIQLNSFLHIWRDIYGQLITVVKHRSSLYRLSFVLYDKPTMVDEFASNGQLCFHASDSTECFLDIKERQLYYKDNPFCSSGKMFHVSKIDQITSLTSRSISTAIENYTIVASPDELAIYYHCERKVTYALTTQATLKNIRVSIYQQFLLVLIEYPDFTDVWTLNAHSWRVRYQQRLNSTQVSFYDTWMCFVPVGFSCVQTVSLFGEVGPSFPTLTNNFLYLYDSKHCWAVCQECIAYWTGHEWMLSSFGRVDFLVHPDTIKIVAPSYLIIYTLTTSLITVRIQNHCIYKRIYQVSPHPVAKRTKPFIVDPCDPKHALVLTSDFSGIEVML